MAQSKAINLPAEPVIGLTKDEAMERQRLRSQSVTLKRGQHLKYRPLAFTEHGAVMAASVLSSPRAVEMSVFAVRAFLRLREWVASQADLVRKLDQLERRVSAHDSDLEEIVQAIRTLVTPPDRQRARIGFRPGREQAATPPTRASHPPHAE